MLCWSGYSKQLVFNLFADFSTACIVHIGHIRNHLRHLILSTSSSSKLYTYFFCCSFIYLSRCVYCMSSLTILSFRKPLLSSKSCIFHHLFLPFPKYSFYFFHFWKSILHYFSLLIDYRLEASLPACQNLSYPHMSIFFIKTDTGSTCGTKTVHNCNYTLVTTT